MRETEKPAQFEQAFPDIKLFIRMLQKQHQN